MNRVSTCFLLTLALAGALRAQAPAGRAGAPIVSGSTSITIEANAVLRTRPTVAAPVVTIVDEPTVAELVEERSGWRRVRIGPTTGWLAPEGANLSDTSHSATREPDAKRLAEALALLPQPTARADALGLELLAPADDAARLERWATVARHTLEGWPARLGVEAVGLDGAAIVLAPGNESAGDAYEAPGSAGGGVAVLRLGERSDDEIEALLVHELSHLASERTFARGLPIWLEEGIAEWQAREPLTGDGHSLSGTLRGDVTVERERGGRKVNFSGPLADLVRLARQAEAGTLPALDLWTAIPEAEFSTSSARSTNYALAGSFVRFLFEADAERAAVVREVLAGAATEALDVDAELDRRLGDVGELDRAFRAWLVAELDRQLVPDLP